MQRWIMEKTEEHFQEAMMENKNSFHAVDPDGDGEREKNYNSKHTSWSVLKSGWTCGLCEQHGVLN